MYYTWPWRRAEMSMNHAVYVVVTMPMKDQILKLWNDGRKSVSIDTPPNTKAHDLLSRLGLR
jgi:hypothetical protein